MKLLTDITQIDRTKWRDLWHHSPYRSPFQSPDFLDVYNNLEGQRADVFVVEDAGVYLALVVVTVQHETGIKAYFSRRGIVYGGFLIDSSVSPSSSPSVLNILMRSLLESYRHQLIYLEIRNNFDYSAYQEVLQKAHFNYVPWLNIRFEGLRSETFKMQMSKARQRQLNKAIRNGVSWREASSLDDVHQFYAILSQLYKYKVKKPLPALSFFEHLYQSSFATLLIVEDKHGILGGVMCPFVPQDTLYEFYICGLDRAHPDKHPSIVAMWAMVDYASQNKIPNMDLMGAGQPSMPSRVRDFKVKFGGKTVENGRFLMVYNRLLYRLGRFYINYSSKRR